MKSTIEKVALEKETDDASRERLERLVGELAELSEQRDSMAAHWQQEKSSLGAVSQLQEEKAAKEEEAARLERDADLAGAAAIRYGELPELERRIADAVEEGCTNLVTSPAPIENDCQLMMTLLAV